MKKLVLFAGVLVAASFAACTGSKEAPAAEAAEAVVEEVVEVVDSCCCADSCCADSCCADSVVAE